MILFFLSISDCQEASNKQAKMFFCHIVYPFIDRTNDDFLESPMVYLAKDNMKNMKFRGGLDFARVAYPYTGGDTG